MMLRHPCQYLIILSLLLAGGARADTGNGPASVVQDSVDKVLQVLTDTQLTEPEKRDNAYDIIARQIDFHGMARRILAVNWKKSTDEQRQQFEDLFRQILLNTYWRRIKDYNGEKVEYVTGMIEGERFATVDTVIVADTLQIPISYRLEFIHGKWIAYDFLIESLSLVTSYRTEYRNIIKTAGIDGLLEHMQEKLQKSTP